jgi:hypothetical protein
MSTSQIESILRRAPRPAAPSGLLERMRLEIVLPAGDIPASSEPAGWRSFLRRWTPGLAFGAFLLSCVVLIGVQAMWISQLTEQNQLLKTATADLPELRNAAAKAGHARAQQAALEQLRKDYQDLQRLRMEVEQLRALPKKSEQLRADNQRLIAAAAAGLTAGEAFFDEARKEAEKIDCVNNLKQLGLAVRLWALDNGDRFPSSLVQMSNELNTVKVLLCPSDEAKQKWQTVPWTQFRDEMSSYRFSAGETDETDPESIVSKCPIHHNYVLADGSVQSIDPERFREITKNGRRYLARPASP